MYQLYIDFKKLKDKLRQVLLFGQMPPVAGKGYLSVDSGSNTL